MGDITLFGLPISLGTMVYQALIFTILVFILKKFVFKKFVGILDNRKQHIENQLQLTEQYKQEAQRNLELSVEVLNQAKKDAREIMKHSENEAKRMMLDAKTQSREILKDVKEEAFRSQSFMHKDSKGA